MRLSLPVQIILGLVLGIFCGLFFGEYCAPLQRIGSAFIMLLKMCVLPYMSLSLMHAIGGLSPKLARHIAVKGVVSLLIVWAISLFTVYCVWLLFPEGESSRFYSEPPQHTEQQDLLTLFIPVNPFHALANDIVPAVVFFSFLFGLALMRLKRKDAFLDNLRVGIDALAAITYWATLLSPIGVFALIASSVGTTPFHQIEKVELYVIAFNLGGLFLIGIAFPLLVSAVTPISARAYMRHMRPALLLSFTTGNILISLPHIVTGMETLLSEKKIVKEGHDNTVETMVPIAYNFPMSGNVLCIIFLLFLSFFYANPIHLMDHIKMVGTSMMVLFGGGAAVINGIIFLIDALKLPIDGIGLFIETVPFIRNTLTTASTASISVVTLLTVCMLKGCFTVRKTRLLTLAAASYLALLATVAALRMTGIGVTPPQPVFPSLSLLDAGPAKVYLPDDVIPPADIREGEDALSRIKRRGEIRIAYRTDLPPFAYINKHNELVGFDIALAHSLADALGAKVVFIPLNYSSLIQDLQERRYDVAMAAISVTKERLKEIRFSDPYMTNERVLVVPDHRRKEFADSERVAQRDDITIGVLSGSAYLAILPEQFPKAKVVTVEHLEEFLKPNVADALYMIEAEGTTWSLIHPQFTAVVPAPSLGKEFLAFAFAADDDRLIDFVDYWLDIKKLDGFAEEKREYWIEGKIPKREPRWSIIRNVLHWVD